MNSEYFYELSLCLMCQRGLLYIYFFFTQFPNQSITRLLVNAFRYLDSRWSSSRAPEWRRRWLKWAKPWLISQKGFQSISQTAYWYCWQRTVPKENTSSEQQVKKCSNNNSLQASSGRDHFWKQPQYEPWSRWCWGFGCHGIMDPG